MTRVAAETVAEAPRPGMFSNARVHGDQFFLSGMHAGGPGGIVGGTDPYLQAHEAFRRVRALTRRLERVDWPLPRKNWVRAVSRTSRGVR